MIIPSIEDRKLFRIECRYSTTSKLREILEQEQTAGRFVYVDIIQKILQEREDKTKGYSVLKIFHKWI